MKSYNAYRLQLNIGTIVGLGDGQTGALQLRGAGAIAYLARVHADWALYLLEGAKGRRILPPVERYTATLLAC